MSLFIDADIDQIKAAIRCGAPVIELTTGQYAEAENQADRDHQLLRLQQAAKFAADLGLIVNGGHGLNYENVQPIAAIPEMHELNIGHSIVAYSVYWGFEQAVKRMKELMENVRINK